MRAVIVYESMFGSTKKVAEAIAEGLADCAEVSVVPVTSANAHILDSTDSRGGGRPHPHPRDVQARYSEDGREAGEEAGERG